MMFSHLTDAIFADRWVLWLIPVLLTLAVAWWYFIEKRNYAWLKISSTQIFKGNPIPFKAWVKKLLPLLRLLTIIALLAAIARPQNTRDEEKVTSEGIDIVLAMDVSSSMLSKDFDPNRMEAAKKQAMDFVDGRPHDRFGVVIFGGESFTQCPVTVDHAVVKQQLKDIKNGVLEDGTAIGMGLATAVQRLKESKAKSKVVILMTDGVNNRGLVDPLTASDIAQNFNVRVYAIGVGTNGQAMTPVAMGPDGNLIFEYAPVEIDEPLLRQVAERTGGQYFRATNNRSLKEIYAEIDKLEKTKIEVSSFEHKTEKYYAFAVIAGMLLLLEIGLRYSLAKSIP